MAKGVPVDPTLKARLIAAAPAAIRDGMPTWAIAHWFGVNPRTAYHWLQSDPECYQARLDAIASGLRFARAGPLTDEQLQFRRGCALRRLAMHKKAI